MQLDLAGGRVKGQRVKQDLLLLIIAEGVHFCQPHDLGGIKCVPIVSRLVYDKILAHGGIVALAPVAVSRCRIDAIAFVDLPGSAQKGQGGGFAGRKVH